ncbi:MAG TPA: alkaline phosphatase family protein [Pyrinomonadaceae bacterium]|nr:alkaline phosphatase family protein [Pyrinomonadaceae bacterium]
MNRNNHSRVLAIGLDAAEPALVRHLIERDEMPALKSLLAAGRWIRIHSPAYLGSGAVWPTFATGTEPSVHGVYGEWCWEPETMDVNRYDGEGVSPFWKPLSENGATLGVLDPPLMRSTGLSNGFEIIEWGAHDQVYDRMLAGPGRIADLLAKQIEPHPFAVNRHDNASSDHPEELEKLSSSCQRGLSLRGNLAATLLTDTRPDFALIVFPEIHHAAHYLWTREMFQGGPGGNGVKPSLKKLFREVDRQIGALIQTAGSEYTVMIFSLHGMRPSAGVPVFLQPLLCEAGFARMAPWKTQSWPDRARSLMAAAKRQMPASIKNFYYKTVPQNATKYLARPTMLPVFDWEHTRAFSLPSDQHGWVRINLKDRERAGIVRPENYEDTCREVEMFLRHLTAEDGRPLVERTVRTANEVESAMCSKLPDLVVHWADAAFVAESKITQSRVKVELDGQKFSGQHAVEGFCILGRKDPSDHDELAVSELRSLVTRILAANGDQSTDQ